MERESEGRKKENKGTLKEKRGGPLYAWKAEIIHRRERERERMRATKNFFEMVLDDTIGISCRKPVTFS